MRVSSWLAFALHGGFRDERPALHLIGVSELGHGALRGPQAICNGQQESPKVWRLQSRESWCLPHQSVSLRFLPWLFGQGWRTLLSRSVRA